MLSMLEIIIRACEANPEDLASFNAYVDLLIELGLDVRVAKEYVEKWTYASYLEFTHSEDFISYNEGENLVTLAKELYVLNLKEMIHPGMISWLNSKFE